MSNTLRTASVVFTLMAAALLAGCVSQLPEGGGNATGGNVTDNGSVNLTPETCAGITCQDTTETCPDGFIASCRNRCVDGICTTCIPDCSGHGCEESWSCTAWSVCENGIQQRVCTDTSKCGTTKRKPMEMQPCAPDLAAHIVISEVYYDTVGDDSMNEWIEVYNPTWENLSLSGYSLLDNSRESVRWPFPNESIVQPGSYFVVARNAQGFRALFGCTPDASGFTFQLNNEADHVGLYDADRKLMDFVAWGGDSGWNLTAKTDTSIKRNPINVDTDSDKDWASNQEAQPGRCFFSG